MIVEAIYFNHSEFILSLKKLSQDLWMEICCIFLFHKNRKCILKNIVEKESFILFYIKINFGEN